MELTKFNLSELQEFKGNYNQHPESQLAELEKSLDDFGQFKNIVVWKGKIIAGNGLVMAAKRKGLTEIYAVDKSDLTKKQAKALLAADNATATLAIPDIGKLESLMADLDGIETPGVNDEFLGKMGIKLDIPDFQPVPENEQPRLDKKKNIICPNCNHEFEPK